MFNLNKIGKAICSINDNTQYKNKKLYICNDQLDDDIKQFNNMTLKTGKFQLTIELIKMLIDQQCLFVVRLGAVSHIMSLII